MGTSKTTSFLKMHGSGNDFIFLDYIGKKPNMSVRVARFLCNRHTGIGADQLILISKSKKADFALHFYNADGSSAEMCGNGMRCAAKYAIHEKKTKKREITFETKAGIRSVKMLGKHTFQANIGEPIMKGKDIPVNLNGRIVNRPLKLESKDFRITCLSMGNPHCVIFVDDVDEFNLTKYGPLLETHQLFPKKINVEFVNIVSKEEIKMRVWERGVGETLGCGSGACAAALASVLNGFTDRSVLVGMPGGKVKVSWEKKDNNVYLTGPVEVIFRGDIVIP